MAEGMVQSAVAAGKLPFGLVWTALSTNEEHLPNSDSLFASGPAKRDVWSCRLVLKPSVDSVDSVACTWWLVMKTLLGTLSCDPLHCHELLGELKHLGVQVLDLLLQLITLFISLHASSI